MTATNHAGHQVETYCEYTGWRRASKVFTGDKSKSKADAAMAVWPIAGIELRVMEALQPAPLTPMQWLGEWVKRVKRFYRINQG